MGCLGRTIKEDNEKVEFKDIIILFNSINTLFGFNIEIQKAIQVCIIVDIAQGSFETENSASKNKIQRDTK